MAFSRPISEYQLIKLHVEDFTAWEPLADGYRCLDVRRLESELDREQEKALLQSEFPYWEIPFYRKMPGFVTALMVAVAHGDDLVAVAYVCDANDVGMDGYAQVHYAVVRGDHRGRRLMRAMVSEMFSRLLEIRREGHYGGYHPAFEIKGGVFFTDREGHRALYERWGGMYVSSKEKAEPEPESA